MAGIAPTPEPPYVAVIFTSVRTGDDGAGYAEMSARMEAMAADQPGYLGIESARDGIGITVSYWVDAASARGWREVAEHRLAQQLGRDRWYASYRVRVATVTREYGDRSATVGPVDSDGIKADLHASLGRAREALVWKLDGLGDYDTRRPMTPTGTNLLGLVKHSATYELEYFGPVFGRPHGVALPWLDEGAEPNADMWATPDETREQIVDLYRSAWVHADATVDELPLDAPGRVPWWGKRSAVTLHRVLVHMVAETQRHAGHADIVRELIDGAAGLRAQHDNLAVGNAAWWAGYREQVEAAARAAGGRG